jgi:hypothetical protein
MRPVHAAALGVAIVTLLILTVSSAGRTDVPEATEPGSSLGGHVQDDSKAAQDRRAAALARMRETDTYVGNMLAAQDSALRRWPDRMNQPLRIYLPRGNDVPSWDGDLNEAVRAAFTRWERVAGVPMRFEFTHDSSLAEVQVRWIPRFAGHRTGQADIVWNRAGWIVRGTLTLATQAPSGRSLSEDAVHTVALHEIGHLLGLGHSDHASDVMHATTEIRDLTMRDRDSAGLLYSLHPGSLKSR